MRQIIQADQAFVRGETTVEQALKYSLTTHTNVKLLNPLINQKWMIARQ